MKRPGNRNIIRSFPHPQEPFDNWFDRNPVISGGMVGVLFAVIIFFGLAF